MWDFNSSKNILATKMLPQFLAKNFEEKKIICIQRYSICLHGTNGRVFKRKRRIRDLPSQLMCRICKNGLISCNRNETALGTCGPKEYFFAMAGMIENKNITTLPFEWMTYDARKLVLDHQTRTKEGVRDYRLSKLLISGNASGLARIYHDPKHICIQKKRDYESNKLLKYQFWQLSIRRMLSLLGEYDIRIFVHQKGQLLRNLGAPTFVLDNHFIKNKKRGFKKGFTYKVDMVVNAVDVLHKRPDSIEPCNDNLYDEDTVWINKAIKILNCTPPFLEQEPSKFDIKKIPSSNLVCSKEKLLNFHSKFEPELNFERIAERYDRPCTEMESTVTSTAASISKSDPHVRISGDLAGRSSDTASDLVIKLHYTIQHCKFASNVKSFTPLSLLSQVGGFIGIFLGYSLLQLPELLVCAFTKMKKMIIYFVLLYGSTQSQQSE